MSRDWWCNFSCWVPLNQKVLWCNQKSASQISNVCDGNMAFMFASCITLRNVAVILTDLMFLSGTIFHLFSGEKAYVWHLSCLSHTLQVCSHDLLGLFPFYFDALFFLWIHQLLRLSQMYKTFERFSEVFLLLVKTLAITILLKFGHTFLTASSNRALWLDRRTELNL